MCVSSATTPSSSSASATTWSPTIAAAWARAERDFQPEAIAGEHLTPELRVVDAAQVDARVRRSGVAMQQEHGGHLRERLEHHDAGQHRRAGKMPLEEFFVDGDVLDGDEAPARLMLGDRVHQEGRLPIAQTVEEDGDVQHGRRNANCKLLIANLFSNLPSAISNFG